MTSHSLDHPQIMFKSGHTHSYWGLGRAFWGHSATHNPNKEGLLVITGYGHILVSRGDVGL